MAYCDRADGDDASPALLLHVRNDNTGKRDGTAKIQSEGIIPLLVGCLQEVSRRRAACIRDAHIDAAKNAMNFFGELVDSGTAAHVHRLSVRFNLETFANGRGHALERLRISRTKRDVSAFGCQRERGSTAKSLTGAGDYGNSIT